MGETKLGAMPEGVEAAQKSAEINERPPAATTQSKTAEARSGETASTNPEVHRTVSELISAYQEAEFRKARLEAELKAERQKEEQKFKAVEAQTVQAVREYLSAVTRDFSPKDRERLNAINPAIETGPVDSGGKSAVQLLDAYSHQVQIAVDVTPFYRYFPIGRALGKISEFIREQKMSVLLPGNHEMINSSTELSKRFEGLIEPHQKKLESIGQELIRIKEANERFKTDFETVFPDAELRNEYKRILAEQANRNFGRKLHELDTERQVRIAKAMGEGALHRKRGSTASIERRYQR